jgi:GT2 family glycosyltransferase
MKIVSVIIVTYHSQSVIFDCLESLGKFNDIGSKLEVIIVDNSPDNSLEHKVIAYKSMGYCFQYIHNPENGGFGQGNNIGVQESKGDVLLFLNPDTILVEGIFLDLLSQHKRGYNVGGFRLVDPKLKDNDSVGLLPEYNWLTLPRSLLNFLVINYSILTKKVYPWGAALFIDRDVFVQAGMFDENIFLCNEEPDLIHRIDAIKLKIINKKIIHLEGHTTELPAFRFKEYLNSTQIYFNKHNLNFNLFLRLFNYKNKMKLIINRFFPTYCTQSKEIALIVEKLIKSDKKQ